MHRFYADGLGEIGSLVTLSEEDARHASRVLRMQPGDAAELFLDGRRFSAEIAEMTADGVTAHLISELPSTEAKLRITLYQGLPKAEKMELIVQKAVELGVSEILPFTSAYTVVKPDERGKEKKRERWQKIAKGAAEQCGRGRIPQIGEIRSFGALLAQFEKEEALKLFCYEREEGRTLAQAFQENPHPRGLVFFVGAEGGFDGKEAAERAGFLPVSLGKRILRCETAPLFVLSAAACAYELM